MSDFAVKLKELRSKSNIPQSVIAKEIGVSETQYQNYEYGKHEPKLKYLIKICEYFNVSANWLLGLSDKSELD